MELQSAATAVALENHQAARSVPAVERPKQVRTQTFVRADFDRIRQPYRSAVRSFLMGEDTNRCGPYHLKKNGEELWYIRARWKNGVKGTRRSLCAKKINGIFFGNATELWGYKNPRRVRDSAKELAIQAELTKIIPMVPFNLFKSAKLDIQKLQIIDQGPEEHFWFGRTNKETGEKLTDHFTGAMLFSIDGQNFIFDLDRNEIKHRKYNAWMSKLQKPCATIAEAYASLKPAEVSECERFTGVECQRQGEWFFIPVTGQFKVDKEGLNESQGWGANAHMVAKLQAKGNRPHYVTEISKEGYVRGNVTHGGHEHAEITLKTWCKAVPNTAVESFKISGMID